MSRTKMQSSLSSKNMVSLDHTMISPNVNGSVYKSTGVDTSEADDGLQNIVSQILGTWPKSGVGKVCLEIGSFANVIDIGVGNIGIAICTDGVGSKSIIADLMHRYDTIGIDCIAMNVNDLICVGARPLSLVDYIALEKADSVILDEIAKGLCDGADQAGISISGGEIAQLKDIVHGFDLVGTSIGIVELDKILDGKNIREGDLVIGVKSNGVHSNGLTLARYALFEKALYSVDSSVAELECTIGEELLKPTDIYVKEAISISNSITGLKAMVNITSDGFLNLTRGSDGIGYVIDAMIEPHPIFSMIEKLGEVPQPEMFQVFNMGTGFCYVVDPKDSEETLSILENHNRQAQIIGYAVVDSEQRVSIPEYNLLGKDKTFWTEKLIARLSQ